MIKEIVTDVDCKDIISQRPFRAYEEEYMKKKMECLQGHHGKTAQFWMSHLDLIERLHELHFSVNTNDFQLRLHCWRELISLCFSTNKQNYARYGAYYCLQSENLDKTHPGALKELKDKGLLVCRNDLNIRQSIDGAGEQTFMKSSKTTGGIKNFTTLDSAYKKWVLTRPCQAEYVDALLNQAGVNKVQNNPRKCLRRSQITKSENNVKAIINVLKNDFIDPFSTDLDHDKLYNLASGSYLPDDVAEFLSVKERGTLSRGTFFERLNSERANETLYFSPIKRVEWKSFTDVSKKLKVSTKGKSKEITVQRDILGILAAMSQQQNAAINIDKALCYPFAPVPLSIATYDGIRRKTAKSMLFDAALRSLIENDAQFPDDQYAHRIYILGIAAIIRSTVKVPNTFKDVTLRLLSDLPMRYNIVYVACDTYRDRSIKNSERDLRGDGDKFVIRSANVRVTADFKKFLGNGDNKERLFELIEEVWVRNRNQLGQRVIYFARGDACLKITENGSSCVRELATDHEEADTKIVYLIKHASYHSDGQQIACVVRSSSGDIDIPIILLGMEPISNVAIYIDNGSGKTRKLLHLNVCSLTNQQKKALVGLHAFTGNDYVASFLRKGKPFCWKQVSKDPEFLDIFCRLGMEMHVPEEILIAMERFVCFLYGEKKIEHVNEASSSLRKHVTRANYVARLWRKAQHPIMALEDPQFHGWLPNLNIDWIAEAYPDDVAELLVERDEESDEESDDQEDSSSGDDE
ncbi:uncharacterized protein LOC124447292 [Xenia sp. Carnegie-2017]|uniref:uncharacterized protein LOC124447292 n=1 Tax=Xenia sp. Carnegie-2017 TaxID=2897299 RepID=UPI001F046746|nr:uncharacterized protein LOC124447292 [Xenia sp. Carnegie-2017]